jgi:hypothetical protein
MQDGEHRAVGFLDSQPVKVGCERRERSTGFSQAQLATPQRARPQAIIRRPRVGQREEKRTMRSAVLSRDSIIAVSKDHVSCDMGGETAILNSSSGIYFGLNGIGARIWELIQQPTSVKDVLAVLLEEYDVNPKQCERDLLALLDQLAEKNLIETRTDEAAA